MATRLLDKMLAKKGKSRVDLHHSSNIAKRMKAQGVQPSKELDRIVALPRRDWMSEDVALLQNEITDWLKKPGGQQRLWPVQAFACAELHDLLGLLGIILVGGGKTLITRLAPLVLEVTRPMLVVPAALKEKTIREFKELDQHWQRHHDLDIVSYEKLGRVSGADYLQERNPDFIIADECHRLKNLNAAVTRRMAHYMEEYPETIFCGVSGTITRRSLMDYQHLLKWAIGSEKMPLPSLVSETMMWARALDEKLRGVQRVGSGALKVFVLQPGAKDRDVTRDEARLGYSRRLKSTPGVVATEASAVDASIVGSFWEPDVPEEIRNHIIYLNEEWETPGGEICRQPVDLWRHARELVCGFYYRWEPEPPEDWRKARKSWFRYVREQLDHRIPGLDSPLQVAQACKRGLLNSGKRYETWTEIKDSFVPNNVPVWVDTSVLEQVLARLSKESTLIWTEQVATGEKLAELSKLPFFSRKGKDKKGRVIDSLKDAETAIVSIPSNHQGRNLQAWNHNMIVSPPPNGALFEQCLDAATEILTEKGWLSIDDPWDESVKIAAYSLQDGSIHWSSAMRIERELGQEKMYGIVNPHLDIRVTAGHQMVHQGIRRFGDGGCDGWEYLPSDFVRADEIPCRGRFPLAGVQDAPGVPLTDAELVFLGLFMSDGNVNPARNSISIAQSERYPEIIKLCEDTLRICGFRYGRDVNTRDTNFGPRNYPLHRWIISKGNPRRLKDRHLRGWSALESYVDKDFPAALENMTSVQLKKFLEGLWAGDGSKTKGSYSYDPYEPKTMSIASGHKVAVDRIQSLCVRRGLHCNVSSPRPNLWLMYISEDRFWSVVRMKIKDGRPRWDELPSVATERVWCMRVDSGAIITRRNGKVVVVGNCIGRTHREGQEADEVFFDIMLGTGAIRDGMRQALRDAHYIEQTTSTPQKLLLAGLEVVDPI